ncbi:MAG TPA: MerR family transcriptional regulator [Pseudonocardiaceae bacterium]|nr:MerR family transcriptional regulator [Pseudonocardiaceae bacterium]
MVTDGQWTIDELTQLVGEALAVDYAGQTNGRVREVPDRRTIRWYTTIGLLDRPAAMRGRTALYGRRHLLQLVAVKRLQADGRTIAEVQTALLGADNATLDDLAQLPEPPTRFWAARPAAPPPPKPARSALVPSVRLADGVTLVLDGAPRQLEAADLAAITEAATALLDLLHDRGLATPIEGG